MDIRTLTIAKEIASAAALEAGRLARSRFDTLNHYEEKDASGDMVTEVDHLAEATILKKIQSVFPEHRIRSEEIGDNHADSKWMWMVDPLDGTNNFAVGLPLFSVSITLLYEQKPVMAVIYEPITDRLYVSCRNEGACCNTEPLSMNNAKDFKRATVGWIQGHKVQNEERAVKLRHYIDVNTKRMMRLWAPTLQWNMLARGDMHGIIVYNSEGDDLYSGLLMVQEAGGTVVDFSGRPFQERMAEPYLIACAPKHVDYFLKLVQEGLR
ncbi:inositol monophosphatase family protein [Paenibacillus solisilvae]|uniref:Inositol monophosphatase family protein n=1 Tax=Paenibacillus solisilvae TaxID=2486751 RepID=A0ABW0W4H2_9BACL